MTVHLHGDTNNYSSGLVNQFAATSQSRYILPAIFIFVNDRPTADSLFNAKFRVIYL